MTNLVTDFMSIIQVTMLLPDKKSSKWTTILDHSVTRLFVCYSGHHSINAPLSGQWRAGNRMPTAYKTKKAIWWLDAVNCTLCFALIDLPILWILRERWKLSFPGPPCCACILSTRTCRLCTGTLHRTCKINMCHVVCCCKLNNTRVMWWAYSVDMT